MDTGLIGLIISFSAMYTWLLKETNWLRARLLLYSPVIEDSVALVGCYSHTEENVVGIHVCDNDNDVTLIGCYFKEERK